MAATTVRKDGTRPLTRSTLPRRIGIVLAGAAAVVLMLGTSVTAAKLITGKQIKDGTVAGRDVRDGSVSGAHVRDGSLKPADYTGLVVGPSGPAGPQGPTGPGGTPGATGQPGVRGLVYATSERKTVAPGQFTGTLAKCPAGTTVTNGGFAADAGADSGRLVESAPVADRSGWYVLFVNDGAAIYSGFVWATCARTQ